MNNQNYLDIGYIQIIPKEGQKQILLYKVSKSGKLDIYSINRTKLDFELNGLPLGGQESKLILELFEIDEKETRLELLKMANLQEFERFINNPK